ncbi:MAG TPA: DUF1707 domain-containing protein [Solirubrobacteraceae bacterium]|nr:DUF1707 domain-containing protein [Solirubrobacteraceae bacterium]
MRRDGRLRASDADREQVVERLRTAAAEGRLSSEELDDRVHRALTAITYDDLDAVLDDLPRPRRPPPEDRRGRDGRDRRIPSHRRTLGGWALTAVRANPLLLFVMIPLVTAVGAMLLAAAVTWMTLLAVIMLLGGPRAWGLRHRRGPWTLMWSAEDRSWDGHRLSR